MTRLIFSAMALRGCRWSPVTLTRAFRRADSNFIELLDNIRSGIDLEWTVEDLTRPYTKTRCLMKPAWCLPP